MQLKSAMSYHFIPIKISIIFKKSNTKSDCENVEKLEPCTMLVGKKNSAANMEKSIEGTQIIKNRIII